jgi:hypothetical protein
LKADVHRPVVFSLLGFPRGLVALAFAGEGAHATRAA